MIEQTLTAVEHLLLNYGISKPDSKGLSKEEIIEELKITYGIDIINIDVVIEAICIKYGDDGYDVPYYPIQVFQSEDKYKLGLKNVKDCLNYINSGF